MNFDENTPEYVMHAVVRALRFLPDADARELERKLYGVTCAEHLRPPDAPKDAPIMAAIIPTNAPGAVIWIDAVELRRAIFSDVKLAVAALSSEFAHVILDHLPRKVSRAQAEREANELVKKWGLWHPWLDENIRHWERKEIAFSALAVLVPGHIPHTYGVWEIRDRLILSSQSQANELGGLIAAKENNQFPRLHITLAANNRFFDIAPAQYIRLTVAATDTARGFSFTNKRFIPRRVRYLHDRETGMLTCELEVEAEVFPELAVAGDAPSIPPELPLPPIAPLPPIVTFPGLPAEATAVVFARTNAIITGAHYITHVYWSGDFFQGGQPTWNEIAAPNPTNPGTGLSDLVVARDGSAIYLMNGDSSVSLHRIWKCENWTSASPTWTVIWTAGDTIPLGNGVLSTLWSYPKVIGKSLYVMARDTGGTPVKFVAKYTGASWIYTTLTSATGINTENDAVGVNEATEEVVGGVSYKLRDTNDAQVGSTWTESGSGRNRFWFWRNNTTGPRYIVRRHTDLVWKLHRIVENDDVLSGFLTNGENTLMVRQVRGAIEGTQVTLVDWNATPTPDEGTLYVSTDGATFTQKVTWLPGYCEPASKLGGNTLVWVANEVTQNGEVARISTDGGSNWSQMNGNIWSLVAADLHIKNAWVVFKRNTRSGQ